MAKTPGPPKAKTAAPAQFDMNSRERSGGKGGFGGPGRGKAEKRAPSQIVTLPAVSVDRGEGWIIQKVAKIDQASHSAVGAEYRLIFDGHDAMVFDYLGAARDRSKEPAPELPKVEAVAETVEPEPVETEHSETEHSESEHVAAEQGADHGEPAPAATVPGDAV